ncbi:MAG: hypothetical protein ACI87O_001555 [Planctomycetota bacterium]|jgi:hypothetical protein
MLSRFNVTKWGLGLALSLLALLVVWNLKPENEPSALEIQQAPEVADVGEQFVASELRGPDTEPASREVLAATEPHSTAAQPAARATSPTNTESLSGQVTLLSGDPLPGVVVYAASIAPGANGATIGIPTNTDRNGLFQFAGLVPGSYLLTVSPDAKNPSDWALPIQGSGIYSTGIESVAVEVDAVVVKVQSPGSKARRLIPDAYRCFHAPTGGIYNEGQPSQLQMASKKQGSQDDDFDLNRFIKDSFPDYSNWSPFTSDVPGPWNSHATFILPTTSSFSFHSENSTSPNSLSWAPQRRYFAVLQAGQPSGFMILKLTDATPDLSTVTFRIDQPRLPDSARFDLRKTSYNGAVYFPKATEYDTAKLGYTELTFSNLMPGKYIFTLALRHAGLFQLIDNKIELDLPAGTTEIRDLVTLEWSVLHVKALTSNPVPPRTFAKVEIRNPGKTQWLPISLHTRELFFGSSQTVRKAAALVGGPAAVSDTMPPGEYRLRVTLPGYRPQEQAAPLGPGETNTFTFDLQSE